jgi:hypothetical protein
MEHWSDGVLESAGRKAREKDRNDIQNVNHKPHD